MSIRSQHLSDAIGTSFYIKEGKIQLSGRRINIKIDAQEITKDCASGVLKNHGRR
ncbi:hypothetical protein SAMN05216604_103122 [Pseudomonas agarici]|nr:hypothetical protein SAMN05216604_103122 [Pseudomonas agarici]